MSQDRRLHERKSFADETPHRLRFRLKAGFVEAAVLDLSESGMKIYLSHVDISALSRGEVLDQCTVLSEQGSPSYPLQLTLLEVVTLEPERYVLRLSTEDEATRACLWQTMTQKEEALIGPRLVRRILSKNETPRIPGRGLYTEEARLERLTFVRKHSGVPLVHLQEIDLDPEELTSNIENLVSSVEVPVGLAGPLLIHGQHAAGIYYAPFATTEGALLASATRGATAITRAGGVTCRVINQSMRRAPIFVFCDIDGAFLFINWVRHHFNDLRGAVTQVSQHAKLIRIEPHMLGHIVHLVFVFETGDAAGQNMTTACTWHACQWILSQMKYFDSIKLDYFGIEGNMSGDKKLTYQTYIGGRGTRVIAECFLDAAIVEDVLKIAPANLVKSCQWGMAAAVHSGMVGYNGNIANVIAAIFTATGQDIACVHECSVGELYMETVDNGVYASMTLPSLILGTIGGGTHLPRQNEYLQMLDCAGGGKVNKLAEIIAGYCLALDLSTFSAIYSGQFTSAHERLGRNRPVEFFVREDLEPLFFQPGLRRALADARLEVSAIEPLEMVKGSSIITELSARKVKKLLGLLPYRVEYCSGQGQPAHEDVMVKIKPLDEEVILMSTSMAAMCGRTLASVYNKFRKQVGFSLCHLRELEMYRLEDPRFRSHMPVFYEAYENPKREAYVLVTELLQDMVLMNSADDVSGWGKSEIETALQGAADFHSVWYGREEDLSRLPWLGVVPAAAAMSEMVPLWEALSIHCAEEFPDWFEKEDKAIHRELIRNIPQWWPRIEAMPRTLVHNDFNPRNLCFRKTAAGLNLVAYDWELATLHLPQHDLAELLIFVLTPEAPKDAVDHYLEHHRRALEKRLGQPIDPKAWRAGYRYCLWDLSLNRVAMYLLAHTFRHYPWMKRVVLTLRQLIRFEERATL